MTNYPPGVSGNEFEIAGPDFEEETEEPCPREGCDGVLFMQGYRGDRWVVCSDCDFTEGRTPAWCCDAGPIGHSGPHITIPEPEEEAP